MTAPAPLDIERLVLAGGLRSKVEPDLEWERPARVDWLPWALAAVAAIGAGAWFAWHRIEALL